MKNAKYENKKAINKKKLQDGGKVRQIQRDTDTPLLYMHGPDFTGQLGTTILQTMLAGLLQKMVHYDIFLQKVQIFRGKKACSHIYAF